MAGEIIIVQGNMYRIQVAKNVLRQIQAEHEADLLLMSEQYENPNTQTWIRCYLDREPRGGPVEKKGLGDGYICIRSRGVTFFSCYFTPNESSGALISKLGALEDVIRDCTGYVVLGSDLNAKAAEWGENTDARDRVGLIVLNRDTMTTFRRPGYRPTIIDITLASEELARKIDDWRGSRGLYRK